jgi:hypothetical protein
MTDSPILQYLAAALLAAWLSVPVYAGINVLLHMRHERRGKDGPR